MRTVMTRRRFLQAAGLSWFALGLPIARAKAAGERRARLAPLNTNVRYRPEHPRLFQAIPAATSPGVAGTAAFDWRGFGATYDYVDYGTGWPWDNRGGDWIDFNGERQGAVPWYSVPTAAVVGPTAVASYSFDVTAAIRHVQQQGRWNAWRWVSTAPRSIAGRHHTTESPPYLQVQYTDGSSERLDCVYSSGVRDGTQLCTSADEKQDLPALLEFERPARAVASAQLHFTVVAHWSGSNPRVQAFLLDPPLNRDPLQQGYAAAHGLLDAGVHTNANTLGVHRYLDGSNWTDFAYPIPLTTSAEREYDPAIYGNGPSNANKLPHVGLGKWINAGDAFSLVRSDYAGEGFAPLTPGLGAVRVAMPSTPGIGHGSLVGYSGTETSIARLFLPEPEFGRLKRLFVRYYMRLGTPYVTPFSRRFQVVQSEPPPPLPPVWAWTHYSGKIGITPSHDTTPGGVSGSSGGRCGWQMRLSWFDCDAEQGGPNENALAIGLHTFDFQGNNPPGHDYGGNDKPRDCMFGQRGGMGGVLYPGRWYCIEMEVDLNTVMAAAPGYLADGAVRIWLDGRMSFERTGMVMRSLPLIDLPYIADELRPVRDIGHRDLWFNWFHGGKTKNTVDRTVFITGLVWGRSHIGPMRLPLGDAIFGDGFQAV